MAFWGLGRYCKAYRFIPSSSRDNNPRIPERHNHAVTPVSIACDTFVVGADVPVGTPEHGVHCPSHGKTKHHRFPR